MHGILFQKWSSILTLTIGIISSLIAGLLLAYFTNILFKPDVLYTLSGFKINLPEKYEKELAVVRAKVMMKNLEGLVGKASSKSLTGSPLIDDDAIFIKPHELNVMGPNRAKNKDSVAVVGDDIEKMVEKLEKPELLKSLLDPSVSRPTAFATLEIVNAGNREATDLEVSIRPNGVLIEAKVDSSEPSSSSWGNVLDEKAGLPIGIDSPIIKRLPPEGKITVRLYWHILDDSKQEESPSVTVKGSYSGGKLRYTESQPRTGTNWPLTIAIIVLLVVSSIGFGYWLRTARKAQTL